MSCSGGKSTKKGRYNKANNLKQPTGYTVDKKVFISIESKALGDTIAWVPYALEFQKKHGCKVILDMIEKTYLY